MKNMPDQNLKTIKAVIVDDERHCRETLLKLLEWIESEVEVLESFGNPLEAITYIRKHEIDLLFLDIDMPECNGFDMLSRLGKFDFDIIFTTAYDEYAIKAFEVDALAYLLKPIGEEDLSTVLNKISQQKSRKLNEAKLMKLVEGLNKRTGLQKIAIPTLEGLEFLKKSEIIRCASEGNYTRIFIENKKPLLISKTLKLVAELIDDEEQFIRPHASHLINLNFIAKYIKGAGGQIIMEDGFVVPVSKQKKSDFFDSLG